MGATQAWFEVVDEVTGINGQGYTLTRVYRVGGETIRVRVFRDSYIGQSFALADVLDGRHWAEILDDPPSNWHAQTKPAVVNALAVTTALGEIADALVRRVAVVLSPGAEGNER